MEQFFKKYHINVRTPGVYTYSRKVGEDYNVSISLPSVTLYLTIGNCFSLTFEFDSIYYYQLGTAESDDIVKISYDPARKEMTAEYKYIIMLSGHSFSNCPPVGELLFYLLEYNPNFFKELAKHILIRKIELIDKGFNHFYKFYISIVDKFLLSKDIVLPLDVSLLGKEGEINFNRSSREISGLVDKVWSEFVYTISTVEAIEIAKNFYHQIGEVFRMFKKVFKDKREVELRHIKK